MSENALIGKDVVCFISEGIADSYSVLCKIQRELTPNSFRGSAFELAPKNKDDPVFSEAFAISIPYSFDCMTDPKHYIPVHIYKSSSSLLNDGNSGMNVVGIGHLEFL